MTLYAWTQIITLPFSFLFLEFTMFTRDQLVLLAKCHRVIMSVGISLMLYLLISSFIVSRQSADTLVRELDKHEVRISHVERSVGDIRIDQVSMKAELTNLIGILKYGLRLLEVISGTLLLQFGSVLFRMKWGAALKSTTTEEFDRRKSKPVTE